MITDTDYAVDIELLVNPLAQAESLLRGLEKSAGGIGLHVNTDETEFMCFNQIGDISPLKVDFWNLWTNSYTSVAVSHQPKITSTRDWQKLGQLSIDYQQVDYIDRLYVKLRSDLSDKIKCIFLCCSCANTAVGMHHMDTVYAYVCRESFRTNAWECCELDWINPVGSTPQSSSCRDTKNPYSKPSKLDEQDMCLLWIPSHGRAKLGWAARTYIQ